MKRRVAGRGDEKEEQSGCVDLKVVFWPKGL